MDLIIIEPGMCAANTDTAMAGSLGAFFSRAAKSPAENPIVSAPRVMTGFMAYHFRIHPTRSAVTPTAPPINGPKKTPDMIIGVFSRLMRMLSPMGMLRNFPKTMLRAIKIPERIITRRLPKMRMLPVSLFFAVLVVIKKTSFSTS